jgi:hypothetical protein
MAMARMGAVARFIEARRRPSHGRVMGNETGWMTKVMERKNMMRVTIEKRVRAMDAASCLADYGLLKLSIKCRF